MTGNNFKFFYDQNVLKNILSFWSPYIFFCLKGLLVSSNSLRPNHNTKTHQLVCSSSIFYIIWFIFIVVIQYGFWHIWSVLWISKLTLQYTKQRKKSYHWILRNLNMSSSINYVFTLVEDDIQNIRFRVNYAYSSVAFSSFPVFWLKYFTGN